MRCPEPRHACSLEEPRFLHGHCRERFHPSCFCWDLDAMVLFPTITVQQCRRCCLGLVQWDGRVRPRGAGRTGKLNGFFKLV